jgi:hypothetical protein
MSEGRIKLSEEIVSERKQIMGIFPPPIENTPLFVMDITNHKHQLYDVYRGMIIERGVIDDCCQRLKRTFQRT